MKKIAIFTSLFSVLIILLPICFIAYVKFTLYSLKNETYNHLIERGYKKEDIMKIDTSIKKLSLYTADVIFKDEPDITYSYKKDDYGNIIQIVALESNQLGYKYKHIE